MPAEDLEALEENIVRSLHATINLRELCWTRDGSLNDRVLRTMFDNLQQLRKLELTGNSKLWSPALLCEVIPKSVCDLQIVLPDRNVIQYLPRLIKSVRRLEAFSLFCMNTSWVTDALLTELAPNTSLRRLTLVGCKAVHGPGILSLAQTGDLSMLALEGLMLRPETFHSLLPYTRKVSSLTVTYPKHNEDVSLFFSSLTELICSCENLTSLTLYARSGSAPALHGDDSSDSEEEQRILTLPERPMHPARSVALPAGIQTAMVPVSTPQTDKNPRLSTSMLRRLIFSRAAKTLQRLWIYEMAVSMHQLQIIALSIMSEHLKDIVVHLRIYLMTSS
ncbi:hypothetical protein MPSI1_002825 [Malassezia psittaci]|uniref:Uncharacterized protein n=1 Tax=Malassezia psittaci TaxID=1821823 RepID=A0AAF0JF86_9BASI|nr:hypothetical protein MPSI1_002825 [Malassezia psittaci]